MNKSIQDLIPLMDETFALNQLFSFPVRGTSMRPIFNTGDIVTLKKATEIKKRDAIFYKRATDAYVLHRVIKINGNNLVVTGDNQVVFEIVPKDNVIGVVVSFKRKGKEHSVNNLLYRLFVFFWCIMGLRRMLFRLKGRKIS